MAWSVEHARKKLRRESGKIMKRQVGLWIDHKETFAVFVGDNGEQTKGEAKGELGKRLASQGLGGRVAGVETADKMTAGEISAEVRQHFRH